MTSGSPMTTFANYVHGNSELPFVFVMSVELDEDSKTKDDFAQDDVLPPDVHGSYAPPREGGMVISTAVIALSTTSTANGTLSANQLLWPIEPDTSSPITSTTNGGQSDDDLPSLIEPENSRGGNGCTSADVAPSPIVSTAESALRDDDFPSPIELEDARE